MFIETVAALQTFRKRHADAQRIRSQYASQPTDVDFAHYRAILKNKAVVDEAEKLLRDFKPVTYDVSAHVKAIEVFEAKAVRADSLCLLFSSSFRLICGVIFGNSCMCSGFSGRESKGDDGQN